jgi:hypothetical protein
MKRTALLCGVVFIASLAAAAPQSQKEPTAIPDLSSPDFGWEVSSGLNFLPAPGKLPPIRRTAFEKGGEQMGDADNPNLTPWAAERMRAFGDLVRSGHRAFSAQSRCWPGGVPGQLIFQANPIYFIQNPSEVLIIWERDHFVRRVHLNREHTPNVKPSWFGESVGHYENGELVVDTIGLAEYEYSFVDARDIPHTKDLHVVERFKIMDGGNTLETTFTVDDPGAFKAPWSGLVRFEKVNRPIEEWACAENNLGYEQLLKLREYPMPVANTPDF